MSGRSQLKNPYQGMDTDQIRLVKTSRSVLKKFLVIEQ